MEHIGQIIDPISLIQDSHKSVSKNRTVQLKRGNNYKQKCKYICISQGSPEKQNQLEIDR